MRLPLFLRIVAGVLGAAAIVGAPAVGGAQGAGRGTIKGHVKLLGKLPGNPVIRMGMDPMCARLNAEKRPGPVQEIVAAALDGSLANVFVHLQGTFAPTPVPKEPVVIDQSKCLYVPRVVGAQVGQILQVRNDDDLLHNVHSLTAKGNVFNVSEPKAGMVQQFTLKDEEMLKIKCDVHSWMTTFVGIVSHPYFAVSGAAGTFEIPNVPVGSYRIVIWHERYGTQAKTVRVSDRATATVDFVYTGNETPAHP
jgi:hypothetical protein